jgi:hypothetical protein
MQVAVAVLGKELVQDLLRVVWVAVDQVDQRTILQLLMRRPLLELQTPVAVVAVVNNMEVVQILVMLEQEVLVL